MVDSSKIFSLGFSIEGSASADYEDNMEGNYYEWKPNENGEIPPEAIKGGITSCGKPIFIGRFYDESLSNWTFGSVSQTIGGIACYNGNHTSGYEIMVKINHEDDESEDDEREDDESEDDEHEDDEREDDESEDDEEEDEDEEEEEEDEDEEDEEE